MTRAAPRVAQSSEKDELRRMTAAVAVVEAHQHTYASGGEVYCCWDVVVWFRFCVMNEWGKLAWGKLRMCSAERR